MIFRMSVFLKCKINFFFLGQGVNIILDCVCGSFVAQNLNCLAMDSRWILYGFLGGSQVDAKFLLKLFAKRSMLVATTLRTRPIEVFINYKF